MSFNSLRAPAPGEMRKLCGRFSAMILLCALGIGGLRLAGFAQMNQPPIRLQTPILPESNRLPDANGQMVLREKSAQKRNFDAANAERMKQLTQATQMLETLAIALKAEVDKPGDVSQNTINKAETIEKLARIVKERMRLTVGPN